MYMFVLLCLLLFPFYPPPHSLHFIPTSRAKLSHTVGFGAGQVFLIFVSEGAPFPFMLVGNSKGVIFVVLTR